MNLLESFFLDLTDYKLFITEQEYQHYLSGIQQHVLEMDR